MTRMNGYMAGCNLGLWLSHYDPEREGHLDRFITAADFARLKEWGLDHIRLPFDYLVIESNDAPGVYLEKGLSYIDRALDWAEESGLNVVLDLHHAPGFFCNDLEATDLFTNPRKQERFLAIWSFLAQRYAHIGDRLRFELLNELVWESTDPWNLLWQQTADAIHAITPDRTIFVGGNRWNGVECLKDLAISENPNILYTFHMYKPMLFTHQRASWTPEYADYPQVVLYPFACDEHRDFYEKRPSRGLGPGKYADKHYLESMLVPAVEFIQKTGRPLYLGEYGVINNADRDSTVRWLTDVADLCRSYGIGRAVWNYREFSSIFSPDGQSADPRIVEAITR